jgi:hypothetical protein
MTPSEKLQGLTVEIIRLLWDHGYYRDNPWLNRIYDNWFSYWVDYKTKQSMDEVDRQIEGMFLESEIDPPVFSEDLEGETPLGGKMELRAPWLDDEDND